MDPYLRDVLDVCLRMLHVVAAIAWIGASFYFVRLDLSLRPARTARERERIAGEFWGVHGGGLYRSQKYVVAPARLPEPLHWFKWEAYTTWLSGFALLVVLYYFDPELRLIDPAVADLASWQAIVLSISGLALAWVVYDGLCRTVGKLSQLALVVIGVALLALASWGESELFAARAAYLQVGAMLGTIMAANVLLVIIPAHRKLVQAMGEGREPDREPLVRAKERSVHNNYLILPALFTMLIGHFAFVFGHEHAWVVLVMVAILLAAIRHFFNLWHTGRRVWWIPAAAGVVAVGIAVWLEPDSPEAARPTPVSIAQVQSIVAQRCATCHSGNAAPLGVRLETAGDVTVRADDILRQAVQTRAMPPGNVTGMTDEERALLAAWVASR